MNLYKLHSQPDQLLGYAQASTQVPEVAWKLARTDAQKRKLESLWAKDAEYAYRYANSILKKRFPAGEAALAQDPEYALWYARDILSARFPAGEAAIAQSAEVAYGYANRVLGKRWPPGEAAIAQDPIHAEWYAHDVLGDPDPKTRAKRYLAGKYK